MKLVITGGHLSPALAVIDILSKDTELLFIGRKYALEGDKALSFEYKEITGRGIPFVHLQTGRLQRRLTKHTLPSLVKLPVGVAQAVRVLRAFKPDVVLLFGGYLSVPVAFAARLLRIPIIIHEQTLEAGFANKLIAPYATKVCISWESSRQFFPADKAVLTGNPIRELRIKNQELRIKHDESSLPLLYITGGSTGSHAINELVAGCVEKLLEHCRVMHQTGDSQEFHDFDRLTKLRELLPGDLQGRYVLKKFVTASEIGNILTHADIVLSRSGINTVTELLLLQKPALLIPLPFAQRNEQLKNAQMLQKTGLAEVAHQDDLTSDRLFDVLLHMLRHKDEYRIKESFSDTIRKDAALRIVQIVEDVAQKKSSQAPESTVS